MVFKEIDFTPNYVWNGYALTESGTWSRLIFLLPEPKRNFDTFSFISYPKAVKIEFSIANSQPSRSQIHIYTNDKSVDYTIDNWQDFSKLTIVIPLKKVDFFKTIEPLEIFFEYRNGYINFGPILSAKLIVWEEE
jgi:hypothetical protein